MERFLISQLATSLSNERSRVLTLPPFSICFLINSQFCSVFTHSIWISEHSLSSFVPKRSVPRPRKLIHASNRESFSLLCSHSLLFSPSSNHQLIQTHPFCPLLDSNWSSQRKSRKRKEYWANLEG